MWKTILISIIIGIIIGSTIMGIIYARSASEYKATIIQLTNTNTKLIKLNSEAEEYNKQLTDKVKKFRAELTKDYGELNDGLELAENNIEELGNTISTATIQIQDIVETISRIIEESNFL